MNTPKSIGDMIVKGIQKWEYEHPVFTGNGLIVISTSSHRDDRKPNAIYYYIRMTYRGRRDAAVCLDRCMTYESLSKLARPEFCINLILDEMFEQVTESKGEVKMTNENIAKTEGKKVDNDQMLKMAKAAVVCWYNTHNGPETIELEDVYIVWFCKTLQNWKALAGTHHGDGMYYEITFNGDKDCAYVDAYKKWDNTTMSSDLLRELIKFDSYTDRNL